MNRRNFLAGISALVGGLAVNEAIPFGRVWSFPSKIVVPQTLYFHRDAFAMVFSQMPIRHEDGRIEYVPLNVTQDTQALAI